MIKIVHTTKCKKSGCQMMWSRWSAGASTICGLWTRRAQKSMQKTLKFSQIPLKMPAISRLFWGWRSFLFWTFYHKIIYPEGDISGERRSVSALAIFFETENTPPLSLQATFPSAVLPPGHQDESAPQGWRHPSDSPPPCTESSPGARHCASTRLPLKVMLGSCFHAHSTH